MCPHADKTISPAHPIIFLFSKPIERWPILTELLSCRSTKVYVGAFISQWNALIFFISFHQQWLMHLSLPSGNGIPHWKRIWYVDKAWTDCMATNVAGIEDTDKDADCWSICLFLSWLRKLMLRWHSSTIEDDENNEALSSNCRIMHRTYDNHPNWRTNDKRYENRRCTSKNNQQSAGPSLCRPMSLVVTNKMITRNVSSRGWRSINKFEDTIARGWRGLHLNNNSNIANDKLNNNRNKIAIGGTNQMNNGRRWW